MLDDKDEFGGVLGWISLSQSIAERIPIFGGAPLPKALIHLGEWLKKWSPNIDKELKERGFLPNA